MRNYLFTLVFILGTTIQAEVYATDTNGYVDQTAWKEKILEDQIVGKE